MSVDGMTQAARAVHAGEGDLVWFTNNLMTVKATAETTGGAYGLVEALAPVGASPPLHIQRGEDETFYVLEGKLSLHHPDGSVEFGPGGAAFAPRGVPHAYRVESETARWLAIATPAGFDAFVREVGEPAPEDVLPPEGRVHDSARLGEVAARYDIELLGPPGTLP